MPSHDPLPRVNRSGPSGSFDQFDSSVETIRALRGQLQHSESMVQALIRECAALQNQLREAGIAPKGARPNRKPPEAGIAVPAVPPKGPQPKQGGAEAPLDFGEDDPSAD